MFRLHERLAADTHEVGRLALSRLLLHCDARFPWLILVPEREGLTGLHQLGPTDRQTLMDEIARASDALEELFAPERINVGALGNLVAQLHVHVIARFESDAAWPGPVWGHGTAEPYPPDAAEALIARLRATMDLPAS